MRRWRWLFVVLGVGIYWSVTGREIYLAHTEPRPMYFTWWNACILTIPWSGMLPESALSMAIQTTLGAILNGILYALFVLWFTRWVSLRPRKLTPEALDYEDGPQGALAECDKRAGKSE